MTMAPTVSLVVPMLAGGIAVTFFAIIFFRLWFLQVLSGDQFLATANDNRIRDVRVQAPRGEVVDRQGRVLVDNRVSIALQVEPDKLPPVGPARDALYPQFGSEIGGQATYLVPGSSLVFSLAGAGVGHVVNATSP